MKKHLIFGIIFTLLGNNLFSQKIKVQFNQNSEFKIVQFTDMHLQDAVSETVFAMVKEIVEREKPDLAVITGDVTYQGKVDKLLQKLASIFAEKKIPWVSVLGNHDDEFGISRKSLSKLYRTLPFNLNATTAGINGETNFIIPIAGKENKDEALLYFFDSNSYNPLKDKVKSTYAWIDFSQINWYRNKSANFTKKNMGNPIPALSFFHIPLPEYNIVWALDSSSCIGNKLEKVCSPSINSGMYTAMLECGDIMGAFVGHDHLNDYIGVLNGIALAYGRFSGSKNTYGYLIPGARVIVLKEGKHEFYTWIREKGGNVLYNCNYPDSFAKKKSNL